MGREYRSGQGREGHQSPVPLYAERLGTAGYHPGGQPGVTFGCTDYRVRRGWDNAVRESWWDSRVAMSGLSSEGAGSQ